MEEIRVLICGDRNWDNPSIMDVVINGLYGFFYEGLHIIEGEANGADKMSAEIASVLLPEANIHRYPAEWDKYGRGAGPVRNKQMLEEGKPDLVIAFHNDIQNSKGTKNMLEQAAKAEVPSFVISQWS